MVSVFTATEVKTRFLSLLNDVADGDGVEITKHGRTVARLVPATGPNALKGAYAGMAMTAPGNEEDLFSTGASWNGPDRD